jgi:hypothetical protein
MPWSMESMMFRVDYRFAGSGVWSSWIAPMTSQGAWGQARAMNTPLRADEVRIAPTRPPVNGIDLKA